MKIVVTSNGADLDAPASPVFGRCPTYVFVDTETMAFEAVENPAMNAAGGAGIQAAQFVVERGAQAVVTGNVGPNASNVFQAAGVPVHLFGGGTVRQAVQDYKGGQLPAAGGANVQAHAGMGMGQGMGRGRGMVRGMGMGRRAGGAFPQTSSTSPMATANPAPSREEEIVSLQDMAGTLRKQLAEVMERLDRLEKGE
ncbi:MAG: NifB/NifX family molybdenum-iron cluster-binding protein [Chloroflexota bacterium]|nr:NifB/NifX family molybdenum-iron cluster-binding protein [Chloroflexota bacterium]